MFDWLFGKKKKGAPKLPSKGTPLSPSVRPAPVKKSFKRVDIKRRFRLHSRLGQGSMSQVWRATDTKTGRDCCLKVLDFTKTEQLKKRFVGLARPDEGEIAVALDHPNVVKTFEYGYTTKREEFLVMELIEGSSLGLVLDTRDPAPTKRDLNIVIQAAEALSYIHELGYIHRDICPRNLMVTTDDVVKLIDFGLAVPNTPEFRRPGNRTGTANYMAPELIRRSPTDERIDVFSFGVTMFEYFTRDLPWESAESMQAMLQHLNSAGRDPREINAAISEPLAKLILKSIERDPRERHPTMAALVADLRSVRDGK